MKIEFTACKYLDFSENSYLANLIVFNSKLAWKRDVSPDFAPSLVQFCKLRGRLNGPMCCLDKDCAKCGSYAEHSHCVQIGGIEDKNA